MAVPRAEEMAFDRSWHLPSKKRQKPYFLPLDFLIFERPASEAFSLVGTSALELPTISSVRALSISPKCARWYNISLRRENSVRLVIRRSRPISISRKPLSFLPDVSSKEPALQQSKRCLPSDKSQTWLRWMCPQHSRSTLSSIS